MPTKDGQIDKIMETLIDDHTNNMRRVIRGALLQAYNRGYEAGCMKAQEQMMEGQEAGTIWGALLQAYNRGYEAGCMKAQEQMMEGHD